MTLTPVPPLVRRGRAKVYPGAGRRSVTNRRSPVDAEILGRVGGLDMTTAHAFVVICEVGSISRAATELGYSQPGLSQRVKAMEQVLGTQLFHRHSKGVRPTEAGELLLPYTRVVVAVVEALAREITWASPGGGVLSGDLLPC